jgi:hypothetical protein
LRAGLERLEGDEQEEPSKYRITPISLKVRVPHLDNVAESLALYEREDWA